MQFLFIEKSKKKNEILLSAYI